ncbi:MAG: hypothetical protein V1816_28265 [Pseudomonadota bacterium]
MKKTAWITVLEKDKNQEAAQKLYRTVQTYGLAPAGHFWQDNLEQMAWAAARDDLLKPETGLWIILGAAEAFKTETIGYGLAMLALGVQAQKSHGFPLLIALTAGRLDPGELPTPLKGADIVPAAGASLGAKIAAKANIPPKKIDAEYRLDVFGIQGLGQWFEVGPAAGHSWNGVMFGVDIGEINAQGVGPAHKLPEKSTLEYPMKGLKLQLGATEFTANAVRNKLAETDSYYLRVAGNPGSILFGPLAQDEEGEAFVVKLK